MRWLFFVMSFAWCVPLSAQLNSDYKTVARKQIKSAVAYEVHNGDTMFTCYNYDREGCIVSIDTYSPNVYFFSDRFNHTGMLTESLHLEATTSADTAQSNPDFVLLNGSTVRYDTVLYVQFHYDQHDKLDYKLEIWKENGRRMSNLWRSSGDTTFFYYRSGSEPFELEELQIRAKVDSVENGFATLTYFTYRNDTILGECMLTVLNAAGRPVREYVFYGEEQFGPRTPGILYSPLGDSAVELNIEWSYKYEYNRDGSLKQTLRTNHYRHQTEVIPVIGGSPKGLKSLKAIRDLGNVKYEYYE